MIQAPPMVDTRIGLVRCFIHEDDSWIEAAFGYEPLDILEAVDLARNAGYSPIAEEECLPTLTDTGVRIYLEKI